MQKPDSNEEDALAEPPPTPSTPVQNQTIQRALPERPAAESFQEEGNEIAIRSCMEMGYPESTIDPAVEQLQSQGKSKYSATEIMAVIFEQQERNVSMSVSRNDAECSVGDPRESRSIKQYSSFLAYSDYQSLITENQAFKDMMMCKICLDKNICIVYLPCGHLATCQDCAPTLQKCCICRERIQGTVKAYF